MYIKKSFLILFLVAVSYSISAQNTIGIPDIVNYTKAIYNAGTSNWDIVQDKNGIVYFANSEGLLSFDGSYWKTFLFPNKMMGRSIAIGNDNRIYAGSQDDFGYFSPDRNGKLTFHSLKPLVSDKNMSVSNVWDIITKDNDVFFRSDRMLFRYYNGAMSVYPARSEWRFLGRSQERLIAQDWKYGLMGYENGVWKPFVEESVMPADYIVSAIVPLGRDSSLITTQKDGFFVLYKNKISRFQFTGVNPFINELILSCTPVTQDWIAIGTQLNGCFIIDKKGTIIQNFSRKEGLQTNCVVSVYLDQNRNLWMGLDNGIDFTAYNNGIKHIYPEHLNEGAGYSSAIYKNDLYIGTSNRLYKIPVPDESDLSFKKGIFEAVPDTRGPVWALNEVNGDLLMAHHEGAYKIINGKAEPVSKTSGYWTFLPFQNVLPSPVVIAGKYGGLDFFNYNDQGFKYKTSLNDFKEVTKYVAVDNNNNIWVATIFKGVFRITPGGDSNGSIKLYTDKNGLPSANNNKLFKIKNRIAVATEKGIYEYNEKTDSFESSAWFKPIFGEKNIRYMKEDAAGDIWFIEEKMPGVVDFSQSKPRTIYFPELNGRIPNGFENINPVNKSNIIIGAEKGFYHINYAQYLKNDYRIEARIRSVRAIGRTDSLIFGGYFSEASDTLGQGKSREPSIANKWNTFHFEYSSPLNEHQGSVEYSYLLKGLDLDWSAWSKKTEKEYTNLPAGSYSFQVKAKDYLGHESHVSAFSFTVLPPWYQTTWAYLAYALVLCGLIYLAYLWQRKKFAGQQRKHEEEQKRLLYLHQLELEKSEKEIITLKNEKLQSQIEHKNTELASVAMHLVQKGELLTKIKEELTRMRNGNANTNGAGNNTGNITNGNGNNANGPYDNNDEFKKIIRILKEEDKLDKDWEHFAVHFDNVHSDFLKDMKDHYPSLTAHELKLSAYLRMNLSSKEIAQLMNISVRGVEISRYRLRKKLMIPTEISLFDFLMKVSPKTS